MLINRAFSFLAWLHGYIYLLGGAFLGCIFLVNFEHQELAPMLKEWKSFLLTLPYIVIALEKISMRIFYGRGQTIRKEIQTGMSHFFVHRDLYFPIKINSGINGYKKAAGYVYVTFRIVFAVMVGFVLGFTILYQLKATYA